VDGNERSATVNECVCAAAAVGVGNHGDDDVTPTSPHRASSEAGVTGGDEVSCVQLADCRLCRHSCADRSALQHHLMQVTRRNVTRTTGNNGVGAKTSATAQKTQSYGGAF